MFVVLYKYLRVLWHDNSFCCCSILTATEPMAGLVFAKTIQQCVHIPVDVYSAVLIDVYFDARWLFEQLLFMNCALKQKMYFQGNEISIDFCSNKQNQKAGGKTGK